jgi:hypothetical protein
MRMPLAQEAGYRFKVAEIQPKNPGLRGYASVVSNK